MDEAIEERRRELAATFDRVAAMYHKYRQVYPSELARKLFDFASLTDKSRVLEIACGSGQFTQQFVPVGCTVTAIDRGAQLANIARARFADNIRVNIETVPFEEFEVADRSFDAVFCAQAFHWLEPEAALSKISRIVVPGGALALIWTTDVSHETDFWKRTASIYQHYYGDDRAEMTVHEKIKHSAEHLRRSTLFTDHVRLTNDWQQSYTKQDYLGLIETYSDYNSLAESSRQAFHAELSTAIDDFGGSVTRLYQTVAFAAQSHS